MVPTTEMLRNVLGWHRHTLWHTHRNCKLSTQPAKMLVEGKYKTIKKIIKNLNAVACYGSYKVRLSLEDTEYSALSCQDPHL